jgi:hypothetical protein
VGEDGGRDLPILVLELLGNDLHGKVESQRRLASTEKLTCQRTCRRNCSNGFCLSLNRPATSVKTAALFLRIAFGPFGEGEGDFEFGLGASELSENQSSSIVLMARSYMVKTEAEENQRDLIRKQERLRMNKRKLTLTVCSSSSILWINLTQMSARRGTPDVLV